MKELLNKILPKFQGTKEEALAIILIATRFTARFDALMCEGIVKISIEDFTDFMNYCFERNIFPKTTPCYNNKEYFITL